MPIARRFTVKGRVQGVFFRDSTRRKAQSLGLTGHAVNLSNGDVDVLACGDPDAVASLAAWLQEGPRMAEVTDVVERPAGAEMPDGFRTG